ncbi:23678_t:CDS:1, partial [Cetraspora pellucida]
MLDFLNEPINIAIDGQVATGKTLIGSELARLLKYKFIDTGLFYRYFATTYYNHHVDNLSDEIINSNITIDDLEKINQLSDKEYLQIGTYAAEIAKDNGVREAINTIINRLVNGKGFVVVGRDVTTKILPNAEIKIVLDADIETRVFRRMNQLEYKNDFTSIFDDLMQHDYKLYDLIQKAKQISTIIDMKNLSLNQVIQKILKLVIYHSLQH